MPAGRKAIPISDHKRKGTYRKSRHAKAEAIEAADAIGLPECPDWLSDAAKSVWAYVAPLMEGRKIVTKADRIAVEALCCDYAEWMELEQSILAKGKTYTTTTPSGDTMIRPHPHVAMRDSAWKRLQCDLTNFGGHPGARSKVSQVGEGKANDPWARFG
jgi:P27 family predicted phage terminase small subunit